MGTADATRWNQRYLNLHNHTLAAPRPFLVESVKYLPKPGLALDLAMGLGRNASFLLSRGWRVVGFDISEIAVKRAKEENPAISAAVLDLESVDLPPHYFDCVLNFYYLERSLFPQIKRTLKPGGVLIAETPLLQTLKVKPNLNQEYLLKSGEMANLCAGLDILMYYEGWVETSRGLPFCVARIVARKV